MISDQKTAYLASTPDSHDYVRFWIDNRFDGMECLSARYRSHRYAPHIHDTYAIGVILSGAEAFRYRGGEHVATPGQVVCVNPFEPHDGRPVDDGFGYKMLYPSRELIGELASQIAERPLEAPIIREAVIEDPLLARAFTSLHLLMEDQAPRLQIDVHFTGTLSLLLRRHADFNCPARQLGRESQTIAKARSFIDDCYMEDVSLEDLANVTSLSRFHFLRAFRKETGTTPHAYITARRISRAKELLQKKTSISQIALECGFFDQSHFSRTFKAWTGVTPASYRKGSNFLQDAA